MRPVPSGTPIVTLLAVIALTLGVGRASAGWPPSTQAQVLLSAATNDQSDPVGCTDGSGGAIYVRVDSRAGNQDIYAQRVDAFGAVRWAVGGAPVCTAPGTQGRSASLPPVVGTTADGAGGVFVCWEDKRSGSYSEIFAQHLDATGAAMWATNGIAVTSASTGNQVLAWPALDGAGGCFLSWLDQTTGGTKVRIQHISAAGSLLLSAPATVLLAAGASDQYLDPGRCVPDGSGGIYVCFVDWSSTACGVGVARVNSAGSMLWSTWGYLSPGAAVLSFWDAVPDAAGGLLLAYGDYQGTTKFVGLTRINAGGLAYFSQPVLASYSGSFIQSNASLVPDGLGGAYVAWQDNRFGNWEVYSQYVDGAGSSHWGSGGQLLSTLSGPNDETYPRGCTDGVGGALLVWEDRLSGTSQVYGQVLSPAGPSSTTEVPVALDPQPQYQPWPVFDGRSGAIVAWSDWRFQNYDAYAQRFDRTGYVGDPAPTLVSAKDVLNDQGGHVKLSWQGSYLDAFPGYSIGNYQVWRSIPSATAIAALRRGARLAGPGEDAGASSDRVLMMSSLAGQSIYWEYVGEEPAIGAGSYSFDVPTASDSTPGSNPLTYFNVVAHAASGPNVWAAIPDSGYSVDNLAPMTPAPFAATYSAGVAYLRWGANTEHDLAGYQLYRGTTAGFTPGASNLVASVVDTGYNDAIGAPGWYYKLDALDIHGNTSGFALALAGTTTGVVGEVPHALALAAPWPNPARGPVALSFELPADGHARLAIRDVAGREVALLLDADLTAGTHQLTWPARGAGGRPIPDGMYFATLSVAGRQCVRRLVVTN